MKIKYSSVEVDVRISILFVAILSLLSIGCGSEPARSAKAVDPATEKMKAELSGISSQDNINLWHRNRPRAEMMEDKSAQVTDPGQRVTLMFKSSIEWLNAGEYDRTIKLLGDLLTYIADAQIVLREDQMVKMKELLGTAYLRKAEIENCLQNHNEYSCLMPIGEPGQHTNREGSDNAKRVFAELLAANPGDPQLKWLNTVALMTLGEYQGSGSDPHEIPAYVFESEADLPRFTDMAMQLGIAVDDISGSVVMDDFNNDHYLDLMVTSYGLDDQMHYFENDRSGGFVDKTDESGLTGMVSGLNMVQADYDNDGNVDVLVLRGAWLGKDGDHPNSLLKNNGDGTFVDVTVASGLYSRFPTQTASWADYDNDGWIDLFIANEHSTSRSAPAQLYHNNQDGTFSEVAGQQGIDIKAFSKGCMWSDYDNDGDMDLFVSVINGKNILMNNLGADTGYKFTDASEAAGVAGLIASFPCWFFDYDQDGYEDLFVSGFDFKQFETAAGEVARDYLDMPTSAEKPHLYHNNGDGTFAEVSKQVGVDKVLFTMGCNFGDLNNDGYPDFYAATGTPDFRAIIPNRMFLNQGGKTFADVTTAGAFGHLQKGHGVAFGDIDNDGDQDVYNVMGGSYDGDNFMNALFVNPGAQSSMVTLVLQGTTSNKSAIGARVIIKGQDSEGNAHTFYQRVNSGASFGANPLRIEQGLGTYDQIVDVKVVWPGESTPQEFQGVTKSGYFKLVQGTQQAEKITVKPVEFSGSHHNHDHH